MASAAPPEHRPASPPAGSARLLSPCADGRSCWLRAGPEQWTSSHRRSGPAAGRGGAHPCARSDRCKSGSRAGCRDDRARRVCRRARRHSVLVQNFRPGTMERLGLGEPALRAENPRLIYVSISGVGESGPYAAKRVYDPIIQGLSGLADLQADPATRRPRMIRTIIADKTTAIFAAQAVTAALFARER